MISKYLKKLNKMLIITGFIWIISLFFAHNTVLAYGTWQGDETSGMPQKGQYSPKGGLLPQILKEKTFSGDADTEFPYTPWSTDVSAGTVYCADSGSAIRYGKYDPALHYANEGVGAIFGIDYTNYSSYKLLMTKLCDEIGREIFDNMNKFLEGLMTKDWKYIATIPTSIGYKQIQGPTYYDDIYDIDTSKPIVVTKANAEYGDGETSYNYTRAEMSALKIATKIFKGLSNWDKTYTTDDKSTNMKAWEVSLWLGDKIDGPKAVIMETEDRAENGYKQKGNTKTANNFTNSKSANVAYILTAMENAYSGATNSIRERYNLADIQTAYWEAVDFDGISKAHETQNGLTLFERAKSYQTFVNKDLTNFQAKIDMSQTQIITNRNTNNYIVGPITINYPYYEDISYLKSIYLKINEDKGASSKTLIYDENNDDFEIEFIGQKVSGSNGLKKEYPASGSQFYIKFSASETAYPTKVGLYADVEHIKSSKIEYNELDTKANVYQYIGFVASSRDYNADHRKKRLRLAYGTAHATITYSYKVRVPKKIIYVFGIPVVVSWKWVTSYGWKNFTIDSNHYRDRTYDIAQPFVMMTREPVDEIKSQKLTVTLEGKREYDVYHIEQHKDNITPPKNPGINTDTSVIDLTMKISGKVWVDGSVGKENQYDGKNGEGDTPMSNVKVSLYEVSKKPTTSTKPKPTLPTPTNPDEPQTPTITAPRFLVYNRNTGEALLERGSTTQCSVASITKIVTALVVAERMNLDDVVTVNRTAAGENLRKSTWSPKLQIVGLEAGDKVTVRDLLKAVLVYSGCDAAQALADYMPGGSQAFVNLMNEKVRSLGATSSHFVTPFGVKAEDKSSAKDLAKILDAAMDNPIFAEYFKEGENQSTSITITRNGTSFQRSLYSTNPLKTTPGIEGTKTGQIRVSGYCVIASFVYENEEYAIVVLGGTTKENRNSDARKLAQWLLEKILYEKSKEGKTDSTTGSTGSTTGGSTGGTSSSTFIEKGRFVAATTTDENGYYEFYGLNSMYNYYVKFTYNGQYYEPTKYNANRDDENWDNNSKGMDVADERNIFNAKFRDIGSAPENLLEPAAEMHTRAELKEQGLIDDFGNIVGEVSEDGTRESTDTYVNESMMDSYTCNGTKKMDLYPNIDVFVNDDKKHSLLETSQVLDLIESKDVKTLYADPDVMRHVNQGLVEREIVDLALRKDVYKATLEINGEVEEYTYDKRNSVIYEGCWDIKGRNNGYYNQNYTREIYREDYSYKVDDYSNLGIASNLLGLSQDSELKVFITYRFTIRNSSYGIATAVTEVVDYYDPDFTPVPERSYLGDKDGKSIGSITLNEKSRYSESTMKKMDGYNTIYVTGSNIYSSAKDDVATAGCFPLSDPDKNKDIYFYVTFEVKKDANRNILLDNDSGKENVAEINGYKSYYGIKAVAPNFGNTQAMAEFVRGDIAGIPDTDSTPGNLREIDTSKFEDDTDKAPNIKITLNRQNVRTIKGTVWEDKRTEEVNNAMVGNGKRDDGETGINGVRVQLVELKEKSNGDGVDGTRYEYIWKEVKTGDTSQTLSTVIPRRGNVTFSDLTSQGIGTGEYLFQGLIPGEYIVRFIYGSTDETVLSEQAIDYKTGKTITNPVTQKLGYNGETTINQKSYNGNDYKSTSYQVESELFNGVGAYRNNTSGSYKYNFEEADGKNQSDAKDIMKDMDYSNLASIIESIGNWRLKVAKNPQNLKSIDHTREIVEKYSNGDVTNELAEILASYEHLPSSESKARENLDTFIKNTYMVAETGIIDMKYEYNREESGTSSTGKGNIGSSNDDEQGGHYVLEKLDFGLVERPKAQLKVTKQVTNVKMTLANNSVLFDAVEKATNVLWMDHTAHGQDTKNVYSTNKNYKNYLMLNPIVRSKAASKGKVQLTMDQELMHGATLQITYAITVANVGEVDYKEDQFYYTGKVGDTSTIVKTNPRKLIDYVGTQVHEWDDRDDNTATRNNLQFSSELNPEWQVIDKDNVLGSLVNKKYESGVKKYTKDHIIVTEAISKDLIPLIADNSKAKDNIAKEFKENPMNALETVNASQSVSGVQLILTQMITQDNTDDDKTYNNMVELVTTKNTVGRKMAYSIVGNQDPTIEPYEIDADDSQDVVILPPFGNTPIFYVLISAVAFILIAGITITIVVLKKHK